MTRNNVEIIFLSGPFFVAMKKIQNKKNKMTKALSAKHIYDDIHILFLDERQPQIHPSALVLIKMRLEDNANLAPKEYPSGPCDKKFWSKGSFN